MTSSISNLVAWKTDIPGKDAESLSEERTGYELMTGAVFRKVQTRWRSLTASAKFADFFTWFAVLLVRKAI
jgi:hypothetical protein